jgi:hypothetical protein
MAKLSTPSRTGAAARHNNTADDLLDRVYVVTRHFSSKTVGDAPPNRCVQAQTRFVG